MKEMIKLNTICNNPNEKALICSEHFWSVVDCMDGHDFEYLCASILRYNGFSNVRVTQGSGDQGIDVLATKDCVVYGIQCKRYSSSVGNKAVQEAFAGKNYYDCTVAVVLSNQLFTQAAKDLSEKIGVVLWDRYQMQIFACRAYANKCPECIKLFDSTQQEPTPLEEPPQEPERDELFTMAVEIVLEVGMASASLLQRRLKLNYSRAARLVDQMEDAGIVGPFDGSKPRKLLIGKEYWAQHQSQILSGAYVSEGAAEPDWNISHQECDAVFLANNDKLPIAHTEKQQYTTQIFKSEITRFALISLIFTGIILVLNFLASYYLPLNLKVPAGFGILALAFLFLRMLASTFKNICKAVLIVADFVITIRWIISCANYVFSTDMYHHKIIWLLVFVILILVASCGIYEIGCKVIGAKSGTTTNE